MAVTKSQELQRCYLQRLYELSGGNTLRGVSTDQLEAELNISDEEGTNVLMRLQTRGLADFFTFGHANITPKGIEEVERIMEMSYAEKEGLVLQKIYDMGGIYHMDSVMIDDLVKELGLIYREVNQILIDLEKRKELIDGDEVSVRMKPAGIELIESGGRRAGATTGINFTTNIHGPNYGGIQQGGQGNTQNVTLTNTNNPDFDRALAGLIELIRSSSMPDDDKQELEEEIGKVNKLALRDPAPGLLERAKSRLDMMKLAITGTDIAIKAAPHIDTLWDIIKHKFGG
jgi:Mn-dependent DtxR family transcriptional regulator